MEQGADAWPVRVQLSEQSRNEQKFSVKTFLKWFRFNNCFLTEATSA
jgi:hypothetical protein